MTPAPIYAGSFDPFTFGHAAVASGALKAFGNVTIAIGVNHRKKGLFTIEERREIILDFYKGHTVATGVAVVSFDGLLVDFCKKLRAETNTDMNISLVRGLRAVSDFEQEMAIADANRRLDSAFQTIFIPTEANHAFVSSSVVKEIAANTRDPVRLLPYVPLSVAEKLLEKMWATGS